MPPYCTRLNSGAVPQGGDLRCFLVLQSTALPGASHYSRIQVLSRERRRGRGGDGQSCGESSLLTIGTPMPREGVEICSNGSLAAICSQGRCQREGHITYYEKKRIGFPVREVVVPGCGIEELVPNY